MNSEKTFLSPLQRVLYMEELCDRITAALEADHAAELLPNLQSEIQELRDYYESPAWLADFDLDREGGFPSDLKRGILAEDTLYDLLSEVDERNQ